MCVRAVGRSAYLAVVYVDFRLYRGDVGSLQHDIALGVSVGGVVI